MKRDRLNEIKKWKDDNDLIGCEVSEHNFYTIHIEWLIEQAERVEELEQQNKRYREAIEKIKKKISKQLEGLDAEEEMQRVVELSELMTIAVGSLKVKEENSNLTQTAEQLDLFGEESE